MIRNILKLNPIEVHLQPPNEGPIIVYLKRPSMLDLIESAELATKGEKEFYGWLLWNHVIEQNGENVFKDQIDALSCPSVLSDPLIKEIDKLYSEGKN